MQQKIIYGVLFSLIAGASFPALVYADEDDDIEPVITSEFFVEAEDDTDYDPDCFTDENGEEICTTLTETELEEGTSGEAEVVCADRDEPGCSEEDTLEAEEESEEEAGVVETWPMVLSFAALGVALLAIVIFNLFGRRHK